MKCTSHYTRNLHQYHLHINLIIKIIMTMLFGMPTEPAFNAIIFLHSHFSLSPALRYSFDSWVFTKVFVDDECEMI